MATRQSLLLHVYMEEQWWLVAGNIYLAPGNLCWSYMTLSLL